MFPGFFRAWYRCAGLLLVLAASAPAWVENSWAENSPGGYAPLFSPELLASLDAETRERFAALEAENYQRWRNRNPQGPDLAAAQRQHAEPEAMLRRIQESRALAAEAKRRNTPGSNLSAKQKRNCAAVAAEIKELSSGGRFFEQEADGTRRYFSDKEIATRVKKQKKSYKRNCKS